MTAMPQEKTLPDDLFRWRSADGSEVTTWRVHYYYNIGSAGADGILTYCALDVARWLRDTPISL